MKEVYETLKNAYYEMESAKTEVENYVDGIEYDEYELNKTINRLEEIKKIKKKYGDTIEEILAYYEDIKIKVQKVENRDEDIVFLENQLLALEEKIKKAANNLTKERKEKGKQVSEKLEKELKELCIENADISFEIEKQLNIAAAHTAF